MQYLDTEQRQIMLTEIQARSIADKVVQAAKGTAHVDTGALKRSISYTYVKEVIIFRQLFYGEFNENSQLEKYAEKYIPNGQPWQIILTKFNGETVEVKKSATGRILRRSDSVNNAFVSTTKYLRGLLAKIKAKKNGKKKN